MWRTAGKAAWHFITLPEEVADEIEFRFGHAGGFGSVPVRPTIGTSTWETSVFPDTKRGSYLLPVKGDVRRKEGVGEGDVVTLRLDVTAD
ncbi:MAG: DUF1905 domain-containing protein [Baekduiaceae bacterium]